jgi:DNA end-binding protein Ku
MMAQRPIWRGQLRLALVSCPVALYAAHHERANLHFHFINPDTGHRVRMATVDAENQHPVERSDLVRGYEFKRDHYLILTDDDFDSVRLESSTTLVIQKFVPVESIAPVYFEASYYVAPDGDAGQDVFAVLRDAIAKTGRMALSRVVIARRERAVAILTFGRGLVAHTLYDPKELNPPDELWADLPEQKPDPEMVGLAIKLIDRQTGTYDAADAEDRYAARLRELIAAKLKGEGLSSEPEPEPDRSNVVDLMAALKQSLSASKGTAPSGESRRAHAKPAESKPTPSKRRRAR